MSLTACASCGSVPSRSKPKPTSCDTLVALGSATIDGKVFFAKNSDRPEDEVQPWVHVPRKKHASESKLRCTYITIPQVTETYECAISQPSWIWGAEMGFNEFHLTIGNESVWTKEGDGPPAFLGMDLVRLGLERAKTARQALEVITKLLETYGQGGPCSLTDKSWTYHNSYIIADLTEAWVLETAGKWWVAERVKDGVRNISNALSIHTKFDLHAKGLQEYAKGKGYWDGKEAFNFAKAFSAEEPSSPDDEESREARVKKMLAYGISGGRKISVKTLMQILRDHEAGVCMHGAITSTGSIISHLGTVPVHYVTVTPNPCESVFKPLRFTEITSLPLESWTEDVQVKDIKERKKSTALSRSDELLSCRLAAEEALIEVPDRDLVLVKLQRQIHALETKYLQLAEAAVKGKIDTSSPASSSASSSSSSSTSTPSTSTTTTTTSLIDGISPDKLFVLSCLEELETYQKIIPPPSAVVDDTGDDYYDEDEPTATPVPTTTGSAP